MLIKHRNGNYPILFEDLEACLAALPLDCRILTDTNVHRSYGEHLAEIAHVRVISPGEASKSLETYGQVLSWLAQTRASRKTTLVAFGGGVIGDLAGFLAGTYMRGIPFLQIPTTLLAQVDSSVGGKVGIDLPEGKNLAGVFYPPTAVSISPKLLRSLPVREFDNGMAEVWKYGFIMDADLVALLRERKLTCQDDRLETVIKTCIELKAEVVQADEFETTGVRAILNFGHTVGHAIEHTLGYGNILHGEAISIGMAVEAHLGELIEFTAPGTAELVSASLSYQGLPITHAILSEKEALISAMHSDKKATLGKLNFSLLKTIGECKLFEGVAEEAIRQALGVG